MNAPDKPMPDAHKTQLRQLPWHIINDYYHTYGRKIAPFSLCFHAGFCVFFAWLGIWPLFFSYLICLLVRLFILRRAENLDSARIFLLMWLLNLTQAFVAVYLLGSASGFHFYILSMLPSTLLSVYQPNSKFIQTMVYTGCFLFFDSGMPATTQHVEISDQLLTALRYFNITMACLMIAGTSYLNALTTRETKEALHRLASIDTLTGLLNRRSINEIALQQQARGKRFGQPVSILLGDVDGFKQINDRYGHAAGDQVLKVVASLFQSTVRDYDDVARWGGEEFLVVFPDTDIQSAAIIAERLRSIAEQTQVLYEQNPIALSLTMGIAEIRPDENWHKALARADHAMYRGKESGKNRVELSD